MQIMICWLFYNLQRQGIGMYSVSKTGLSTLPTTYTHPTTTPSQLFFCWPLQSCSSATVLLCSCISGFINGICCHCSFLHLFLLMSHEGCASWLWHFLVIFIYIFVHLYTVKISWFEQRWLIYLGWFKFIFESLWNSSDSSRKQIFREIF